MDDDQGFSVRDRRSAAADPAREERKHGPEADPMARAAKAYEEHQGNVPADLDFSTFIISLATSAQVGLGAVPHPETNTFSRNIPAAKQMIDILAIVREKTRGNLTEPESALLEQVLFNLHIHYVRTVEEQKKSGG
ncbi:MAG: DUF1844 domain-containing protein [Nitrospirota bacterium]